MERFSQQAASGQLHVLPTAEMTAGPPGLPGQFLAATEWHCSPLAAHPRQMGPLAPQSQSAMSSPHDAPRSWLATDSLSETWVGSELSSAQIQRGQQPQAAGEAGLTAQIQRGQPPQAAGEAGLAAPERQGAGGLRQPAPPMQCGLSAALAQAVRRKQAAAAVPGSAAADALSEEGRTQGFYP